jgi:hypothetical protein
MPWIKLPRALDRIGHVRKDELRRACRAGDVKSRLRYENGAAEDMPLDYWDKEIDWERGTLTLRDLLIGVLYWSGESPPPLITVTVVEIEIDEATLRANFPEVVHTAKPVPSSRQTHAPEGLVDWYVNEHIPAGYSNRENDLVVARARFGRWMNDRDDVRRLREQHAPDWWHKSGPRSRQK